MYYHAQVELLIQCLPAVAAVNSFVLKGGTAINLFVRPDFPRLSIDIDLIYLPLQNRLESLSGIETGLLQIQKRLINTLNSVSVTPQKNGQTKTISRLTVERQGIEIKIEPNLVLRGTVYPAMMMDLSQSVVSQYGHSVLNMPIASKADLYGGKICAALDRQHPRDLFDIKRLLDEGITEETKKAFLVYLASHNRPMHELLQPNRLDLIQAYQEEFVGMSMQEISYESLMQVREDLIKTLNQSLTEQDKAFLIGIKNGVVNGDQIGLVGIEKLPGIQWKIFNIGRMNEVVRQRALEKLITVLNR